MGYKHKIPSLPLNILKTPTTSFRRIIQNPSKYDRTHVFKINFIFTNSTDAFNILDIVKTEAFLWFPEFEKSFQVVAICL